MMRNAFTVVLLTAVAAVALTGCMAISGGSEHEHRTSPTLGAELMALQAAREKGAISEAEWTEMRSKLIASRDWAHKRAD